MRNLLHLSRNDIRSLCGNQRIYNRGETYWEMDLAEIVKVEPDGTYMEAVVMGNEDYEVTVGMNGSHIHADCACPAFETYPSWCKHIVAALLEMHELHKYNELQAYYSESTKQLGSFEQARLKQKTDEIIQLFKGYNEQSQSYEKGEKETLLVEYLVKMVFTAGQTMLGIELKVGPKRPFVVKNMKQFLLSVAEGRIHHFTKTFTYEPDVYQFQREDAEILDKLVHIVRNESFYKQAVYFPMLAEQNHRLLIIPPFAANEIFPKLSSRPVKIEDIDAYGHTLQWQKGLPELDFQLEQTDDANFLLSVRSLQDMEIIDLYGYLYHHGCLYELTESQLQMLKDLKETMPFQGELTIAPEQMEGLVSNVIPALKRLGTVSMSEGVSQQIKTPPLHAKIMADIEGDRLTADLQFQYGETTIQPLIHTDVEYEEGAILMRDIDKENRLLRLIETTPFKWNGRELFIEGEEQIYQFLYESLPDLQAKADVYLTQSVKDILFDDEVPETNIDLQPSSRLLEINFNMTGIDPAEVETILKSVVEKKKYYRLSDGRFVSLERDEFQSIRHLFEELNLKKSEINGERLELPAMRALQVEGVAAQSGNAMKIGKQYRRLLDNMKHPDNLDFEVPDSLQGTMRDYQKAGFQWLKTLAYYHFGGILADDMGLGKTLQSIAYILSEKEADPNGTVLIVAPASLVYNWQNECRKFAPTLRVGVAAGDQTERKAVLEDLSNVDVLVTSYPLIRRDIDLYQHIQFASLILDEAQAIKNAQTQTAQAVKQLKAVQRFALSGTPIENTLDELWSIFQTIMPGFFPGKTSFKKLSQEKISRMVRPFVLRRMKKEVLKELPDKIETTNITELTSEQKTLYLGYLQQIQQETKETLQSGGLQRNRMKILAGLTRLRQLCCHPGMFLENYTGTSGKFEQLLELLEEAQRSGRRVLIFSQFTSMLAIIRQELDRRGASYFYLDGQTPSEKRVKMTEQFNEGERDLFLVSLKAGGTGLNLTGADTVILYDLWWNPAVDSQAIDRAYRIGQKNVVQVIRLITHGTIEEKIYDLQQKKKALIENVIQPGETMLSSLSENEIRELLSLSAGND
ncbi:DEAD/DEAH box helicase [Bacillus tianshenii]|nr:DEAD/DEAH box helicase [Bacillus tianshenii]